MPAAASTAWQFLLAETTARRSPASPDRLNEPHRPFVDIDTAPSDEIEDEVVLAVPQPVHG